MLRSNGSPGSNGTTILVVDDEASVLALVRTMLWRAGFVVLEASGPEEALSIASSHSEPIQLLLTDVLMPGSNGYDLAEKIVAIRSGIKVLFMSGYRDKVLVESTGRPLETFPLIRKPFTQHSLVEKISEMLEPVTGEPSAVKP